MKKILPLILCVVLLASCRTHRHAVKNADSPLPSAVDHGAAAMVKIVERVNANRQTEECITARMNLSLDAGVSVGGTLRMKRNDVIQLSLMALGLMEVGRMELTPDYMMVIDRMGHQFVKVDYDDVPFMKQAGIDFFTFQSLFWDELFLFGDKGREPDEKHYEKTLDEGILKLVNNDSRQMVLTFLADAAKALVTQTSVSAREQGGEPVLDWQYQAHTRLGQKQFPSKMQIRVNIPKRPVSAQISLSNVKNDSGWETRTQVNAKKYKEVTLGDVTDRIRNLLK